MGIVHGILLVDEKFISSLVELAKGRSHFLFGAGLKGYCHEEVGIFGDKQIHRDMVTSIICGCQVMGITRQHTSTTPQFEYIWATRPDSRQATILVGTRIMYRVGCLRSRKINLLEIHGIEFLAEYHRMLCCTNIVVVITVENIVAEQRRFAESVCSATEIDTRGRGCSDHSLFRGRSFDEKGRCAARDELNSTLNGSLPIIDFLLFSVPEPHAAGVALSSI